MEVKGEDKGFTGQPLASTSGGRTGGTLPRPSDDTVGGRPEGLGPGARLQFRGCVVATPTPFQGRGRGDSLTVRRRRPSDSTCPRCRDIGTRVQTVCDPRDPITGQSTRPTEPVVPGPLPVIWSGLELRLQSPSRLPERYTQSLYPTTRRPYTAPRPFVGRTVSRPVAQEGSGKGRTVGRPTSGPSVTPSSGHGSLPDEHETSVN